MNMKTGTSISHLLVSILLIGLISGFAVAQAQPARPAMDPATVLKNALQSAGAAALTSAQESSIKALVEQYRITRPKPSENTAVQSARTAYETAILNGDSATAVSQAAILGNAQASETAQRESDAAVFAIGVLNILKTGSGQVDALITRMGSSGLVRLLLNLAGGPRGFGPGPGGPGRGRGASAPPPRF
jgi:hypothetical protein